MQSTDLITTFQRMYSQRWRYEWGAAREYCVDCSGAFVYAYRLHGLTIPHGSNAIARNCVTGLLPITEAAPGMAAFKLRAPGAKYYDLPSKYRNSLDKNDYYHIGLVDADGRHVLNAKSQQSGFSRDPISAWHRVARLTAVTYDTPRGGTGMTEYIVTAANGKPVALRSSPKVTDANLIVRLPVMTRVQADPDTGTGWQRVQYNAVTGYMMSQFLVPLVPTETIAAAEQQAFENLGIDPGNQNNTDAAKEKIIAAQRLMDEALKLLGGVG